MSPPVRVRSTGITQNYIIMQSTLHHPRPPPRRTSHHHRASMQATCSTQVLFSRQTMSSHDHMSEDDCDDADSDVYSVISGSFSNFSAGKASSVTTADEEMRSVRSSSPAPSVMTMTSSIRAASYRHEYGRGLNNYSEVYRLPADDEELDRLGTY